jgi:hypothetical protein
MFTTAGDIDSILIPTSEFAPRNPSIATSGLAHSSTQCRLGFEFAARFDVPRVAKAEMASVDPLIKTVQNSFANCPRPESFR